MNNLKEIMKQRNVNISHMSLDTGYSRAAIYKLIDGRNFPRLHTARDIAGYLGVTDRDIWQ